MASTTPARVAHNADNLDTSHIRINEVLLLFFSYVESYRFKKAVLLLRTKVTDIEMERTLLFLIQPLLLFVASENIYCSLAFFGFTPEAKQEFFAHTEMLALLNHLTGVFDNAAVATAEGKDDEEGKYFSLLIKEMCILVHQRKNLVELYLGLKKVEGTLPDYEKLCNRCRALFQQVSAVLTHPLLQQIGKNFITEIETLEKLCKFQLALSKFDCRGAIRWAHQCKSQLDSWDRKVGKQKLRLQNFASEFYLELMSKLKLYFNLVFKAHKAIDNLPYGIDFEDSIATFCKVNKVFNVSIVLEADQKVSEEDHYTKLSYWPAVFSYPQDDIPAMQHKVFVGVVRDFLDYFETFPAFPAHTHDKSVPESYYVLRLEPRYYLCVVVPGTRSKDDTNIHCFMADFAEHIQNQTLINRLMQ